MKRKYACNRLYLTGKQYIAPAVVTLCTEGEVESYAPLEEETSGTEWIGGVIVLAEKREHDSAQSPSRFFNERRQTSETPLYAWHIMPFDFEHEEPTPQSIIRRL